MSTVQKQSVRAQQTVEALEPNEFSDLLQREFKPKTDQAREAVQNAVKTLAVQALESSVTISNDAYRTVQAIITEIDRKLSEQINQIFPSTDSQNRTIQQRWLDTLGGKKPNESAPKSAPRRRTLFPL